MLAVPLMSAVAALLTAQAEPLVASACQVLPQVMASDQTSKRGVTAEDVARLRDIGTPNIPDARDRLFTLSPDSLRIAFQIRQGDAASNRYCLGMVVVNLTQAGGAIVVDQGGDFVPMVEGGAGFADMPPSGLPRTIQPLWSADGQWIAYLRKDEGRGQVWRARSDGTASEQVTHLPFNVEAFAWTPDGTGITARGRPGLDHSSNDIAREGLSGYRYDERTIPSVRSRPFVRDPIESAYVTVSLDKGTVTEATADERAMVDPTATDGEVPGAVWTRTDRAGNKAWVMPQRPDDVSAPTALHVRYSGKSESICVKRACQGVLDAWFDDATGDLYYLRSQRGDVDQQFYRWSVGAPQPDLLFRTESRFASCQMLAGRLLCTVDELTRPRRIIMLNLASLNMFTVFDPNPEFSNLRTGTVRLLRWTNAYGVTSFGHLVLPPDHRKGDKHPLVVVGYNSRGFLRGGTGDEYPILALAEAGFAVLNYQTPVDVGLVKGAKTWGEVNRINRTDWQDVRNTVSSIDSGIDAAVATGAVDPTKIGLTGMSYGSVVAQFALVNSRRFGAAVLSSCCEEGSNGTLLLGPGFSKSARDAGYPRLIDDGYAFWKPVSFRLNATTMGTPLLVQIPDQEFLNAMEGVTALREAGQAVDVYTFPDERHVKWQPAHRLAVYRRSIQWFDFWLRGLENRDPVQLDQYEVWRELKRQAH